MALKDLYPFATQDGQAIPLDIINPAGLVFQDFILGASTEFTIPAGYEVGTFFATKDCIVSFGADLVSFDANTMHTNTLLLPAGVVVTAAFIAGPAYVRGIAEVGTVYMQLIEKWAGLGLPQQFVRK